MRSLTLPLAAAAICLGAGAAVARKLTKALAISHHDKSVAPESSADADRVTAGAVAGLGRLHWPQSEGDPLADLARRRLQEAVDSRTVTADRLDVVVQIIPGSHDGPEAFTATLDGAQLRVVASDRRGAAQGLFQLAHALTAGRDWTHVATGEPVAPHLRLRFADAGAVGLPLDEASFVAQTDYQHNVGMLSTVLVDGGRRLDLDELAAVTQQWRDYVDRIVALGYNGIYLPGFLEYVDFDRVGDGFEVYPEGSAERAQHQLLRDHLGPVWRYAHELGLEVIFKTDMLALSGPLEAHLRTTVGDLDATDPRLWQVYAAGLAEFFDHFDWCAGLQLRIGEGGSIYNAANWNYYSKLAVTEASGVQAMLRAFTEVATTRGKQIHFRTWSVGVGDIGDIHTNPATYHRVLDAVDADNLVVSTKLVSGDYDSWLQLNDTLRQGRHRRIVELQGRREFEAFSAVPNDLTGLHQQGLAELRASNPRIDGLWLWTQDGGPIHAGPMSLYLRTGFWQLWDVNVEVGARLGWRLDSPADELLGDWLRRVWSHDETTVAALSEVFRLSREAVLTGFYLKPFAERQVKALGLEPPPMLWIFKWDIVSGDSAALSAIADSCRGREDEVIADGHRAVELARRMQAAVAGVDASALHDPSLLARLQQAVDYEVDLFEVLAAWRETFLRFHQWLATGSVEALEQHRAAVASYRALRDAHLAAHTGNVDTPPYVFDAADRAIAQMEAAGWTTWLSRALVVGCVLSLVLVQPLRHGLVTPWLPASAASSAERWATCVLPMVMVVASRWTLSSGQSPTHLACSVGALALMAVAARAVWGLAAPDADPIGLWGALGGTLVARTLVSSSAMAEHGPLGMWRRFWTQDRGRSVHVTLTFAAWLWTQAALASAVKASGGSTGAAVAAVTLGLAAPTAAAAGALQTAGLEKSLTRLNDEMAVVPLGLSRILGLVVHLGIPERTPRWLGMAAGGLAGIGLAGIGLAGRASCSPHHAPTRRITRAAPRVMRATARHADQINPGSRRPRRP